MDTNAKAIATEASAPTIWLTTRQLAEHLNLSVETIHSWTPRGYGPPCFRFTKRCIRYRLADVEAWIAKSFTEPSVKES